MEYMGKRIEVGKLMENSWIMDIKNLYSLLTYSWIGLFVIQYITFMVTYHIWDKKDYMGSAKKEKTAEQTMEASQPMLFISMYNAFVLFLFSITKLQLLIYIGIPLGAILLYLSTAGDFIEKIIPAEDTESNIVEVTDFRNVLIVVVLSVPIFSNLKDKLVVSIDECSEFYGLVEVAILVMLAYVYLRILMIDLYIICG